MKGLFLWIYKKYYSKHSNAIFYNVKYLIHRYVQNKLPFSACMCSVSNCYENASHAGVKVTVASQAIFGYQQLEESTASIWWLGPCTQLPAQ